MHYIGDTKAGTLVGTDRMGNKYFENITEDLPLRVRLVAHPILHAARPSKHIPSNECRLEHHINGL